MKTILIAEPDPSVRKALVLMLSRKFGMVEVCESMDMLSFAISMVDCIPGLLLFDAALFNLTALEACLLLRRTYPSLKLILLSANDDDAFAAQNTGVYFVHKGANPEKLIATLTALFKE
jgi:DNA-binding response OmpR family regulator